MSRDGSAPVGTADGAPLEVSMQSYAQDSSSRPSQALDAGQRPSPTLPVVGAGPAALARWEDEGGAGGQRRAPSADRSGA
jgi:hypothetical protein